MIAKDTGHSDAPTKATNGKTHETRTAIPATKEKTKHQTKSREAAITLPDSYQPARPKINKPHKLTAPLSKVKGILHHVAGLFAKSPAGAPPNSPVLSHFNERT